MCQAVLFIKLLLVHYATQSQLQAACNTDVALQCPGVSNSTDFLSVTWYKFMNNEKAGIIRGNGVHTPQRYKYHRDASLGDKQSLLLGGVTPEDSGRYECAIHAKVGGKNQYYEVHLTVHECTTQLEMTTVPNTLTNMTLSSQPCHKQGQDLPVVWSVVGYVALAVAKIILSLFTIWIFHIRSSRRWQHRLCS
ncbi:uncharacterized protein LOC114439149 isoform X2 [Parambassis ranga]|uniref:Uncharacterized protein LOC114439149 isoform X2 n=1 Tax=Parambassis ranga TaxID=210632 RepID=A0A6P7IWL3_9TELE|nr:uncharacterized protein LOC114439149 isoform X2 [Parambassis ranga]